MAVKPSKDNDERKEIDHQAGKKSPRVNSGAGETSSPKKSGDKPKEIKAATPSKAKEQDEVEATPRKPAGSIATSEIKDSASTGGKSDKQEKGTDRSENKDHQQSESTTKKVVRQSVAPDPSVNVKTDPRVEADPS
ncbi:hypothetical protein BGZ82_004676 [Podila clonocystis]|nr:hypothetical protein BGZ82_004676 [Podila clonocystis]